MAEKEKVISSHGRRSKPCTEEICFSCVRTVSTPEKKGKCILSYFKRHPDQVHKCDGEQPCSGCKSSSTSCVYGSRDRRLREHRGPPEVMDDLQARKQILDQIWQKLSSGQGQDLLNQIQAGIAFDDVAKQLAGPDVAAKLLSNDHSPSLNALSGAEPQPCAVPSEPQAGGDQTHQEREDKGSDAAPGKFDSMSDASQPMPDRSTWHPSLQIRWQKNEIVVGSKCTPLF